MSSDEQQWIPADPNNPPTGPYWALHKDGSERANTEPPGDAIWALCQNMGLNPTTHWSPIAAAPPLPEPEWSHDAGADLTAGAVFTKHHYPPSQEGFSLQLRNDALLRNVWTDDVHAYMVKALDAKAREPQLLAELDLAQSSGLNSANTIRCLKEDVEESETSYVAAARERDGLRIELHASRLETNEWEASAIESGRKMSEMSADLEEMRGCATPEAGAEAQDLRREIESLVTQFRESDTPYVYRPDLIGTLRALLDRVDARDSLAHLIRTDSDEMHALAEENERLRQHAKVMNQNIIHGQHWIEPDPDNPPAMPCIVKDVEENVYAFEHKDAWMRQCSKLDHERITGYVSWPKEVK